jgi:ketosteroid isomerase-like protein
MYVANKTALDARADEIVREQAPIIAAQAAIVVSPGINEALQAWAAAWRSRDVAAYLNSYAQNFVPEEGITWDAWAAKRKRIIGNTGEISLELSDIKVGAIDATHASTEFRQKYRSPSYSDVVTKTLDWVRMDNRWVILRETVLPVVEH